MIQLSNGKLIVESINDLPNIHNAKRLYLDVETTSGDRDTPALRPYHGHRIAGFAMTVDKDPRRWYVPVRHCGLGAKNITNLDGVFKYVNDIINSAEAWINHNIKFDCHFLAEDGVTIGDVKLHDTRTLCKLYDSDRFSYGIDELLKDWLEKDMPWVPRLKAFLDGAKTKDYGEVPIDLMAEYACDDVGGNRELFEFIDERYPAEARGVWNTEVLLTPVLFDMERDGMRVNPMELKKERVRVLHSLIQMEEQLKELLGYELNPKSHDDVYDVLVNRFGLPIIKFTKEEKDLEEGEELSPSFDKEVLEKYRVDPIVLGNPSIARVVNLISTFRKDAQYNSLFVTPYSKLNADGVLHPDFNQCVRTGRMSCSKPNAQQLNKRAKRLVLPGVGESIMSADYSQIEFRLIVHYINDEDAIRSYNENPDIDFHQWVADMIKVVRRKPAKCINFAMGFGAGKRKILSMIAKDPDVIEHVSKIIVQEIASGNLKSERSGMEYEKRCNEFAQFVFSKYHDTLPGIKIKGDLAMRAAKYRGYVFNAYGRRRHLQPRFSYRAFPSVIQSCAADVMKERAVAIAPRYNRYIRELGIKPMAIVHDDLSSRGPTEVFGDPTVQRYIVDTLEDTTFKFRVPIRTKAGVSATDWAEASDDKAVKKYDAAGRQIAGPLDLPPKPAKTVVSMPVVAAGT